ncbi:MAG TPA: hypothetical protein VFX84_02595, partial [Candidatus Saccharimonadales bacterium]|nr:hypothetical protein [Candidatus Saccharimonadales bacterium]
TPVYIGVILESDSDETSNWYEDNPEDRKISEGINDHLSDSRGQAVATKYPVFDVLPAVFGNGQGGLTRIDSEAALDGADKPSIGIYAVNPQQRQLALAWIDSRGYTLSDVDVVFYGANIPLETRLPR